ncbi:hypothetical protein ACFWQG_06385 [Rhodococcus sp. NPDC058532]|uniref:hypothetical protein n=1 Tax=Rhodococcus sp. NPDC058532 TaxID=3346540 RepID=UPI0036514614
MRTTRIILLLTTLSVVGGCANTVDGAAGPAAEQPGPGTTTAPAPAATTTRSTSVTPSAAPAAQVADYLGEAGGSYYFTSPSGKFECAVITAPTPVAGCHGSLPGTAPRVPAPSGPGTTIPNAIRVVTGEPGEFVSTGDPAFHRFDGPAKALPYGSPLRVQGFTCTVDRRAGVTCESGSGHGFTVSDVSYDLW